MLCKRSLKQTTCSLSSCEAEFYTASAFAGELFSLAELLRELYYKVSVRLEMDSDSARQVLQRKGDASISKFVAQQYNNGSEKSVYRLDAWIRKTTQQISLRIFYRDHERSRYPRNLGDMSMKTKTTESLTTALPVEQRCKYPQFRQLTVMHTT